jgi:aminoglycoside phosphotransferase (APT) family kinase protein
MTDPFLELAARVAPGATVLRTWPLKGGVSAYVHALELAHPDGRLERLVVRRHGALAKGHRPEVAADEFRLLQRLHAAGLPVPAPRWLDAAGEIFGTPCLVVDFVDGSPELPADPLDAVERMATLLAEVHALDVDALGVGFLPRRVDPADEGGDPIARHTPLDRLSLLHGDFCPGNLLWRGGRIVALLDWEDAAIGDPLSDVAGCRQELLWKLGDDAPDAFTLAYERPASVDHRALAGWDRFVATAALEHMGQWGLEPERVAEMRRRSEAFLDRSRRCS